MRSFELRPVAWTATVPPRCRVFAPVWVFGLAAVSRTFEFHGSGTQGSPKSGLKRLILWLVSTHAQILA